LRLSGVCATRYRLYVDIERPRIEHWVLWLEGTVTALDHPQDHDNSDVRSKHELRAKNTCSSATP
jgi:hypothetical protein